MKSLLSFLLVLSLLAVPGLAQQPNSANATMVWNNQNGPSWPILGVPLPTGVLAQIDITGVGYAPFALATAASIQSPGIPVLSGSLLDLDFLTATIIWDPTTNPAFTLDPSGTFQLQGVLPNLPAGIRVPYQAAVYDPTAAENVTLTAATEVVTTIGIITLNHALSDDNSALVNLNPYGFTIPFYGTEYSSYYVNANGFISFNSGTTDFTSSPSELVSQMPRVLLLWTDLAPNTSPGGTIRTSINLQGTIPQVRVDYNGIFSFGTGQPVHTMSWVHNASPDGSLQIIQPPTQQASLFTMMTGIGRGSGGSTSTAQTDFTAVQAMGGQAYGPGVAIFEWFGFQGQTYYTGPTNLFDLIGVVLNFFPNSFGTGTPGSAGYFFY